MANDNHDDHGRFASGSGGGPAHAGGHADSVPTAGAKMGATQTAKQDQNVSDRNSRNQAARYNAGAVQKAIESSSRHGPKIGAKEGRAIHALLRGRH
jgi:hypothetical protein